VNGAKTVIISHSERTFRLIMILTLSREASGS